MVWGAKVASLKEKSQVCRETPMQYCNLRSQQTPFICTGKLLRPTVANSDLRVASSAHSLENSHHGTVAKAEAYTTRRAVLLAASALVSILPCPVNAREDILGLYDSAAGVQPSLLSETNFLTKAA